MTWSDEGMEPVLGGERTGYLEESLRDTSCRIEVRGRLQEDTLIDKRQQWRVISRLTVRVLYVWMWLGMLEGSEQVCICKNEIRQWKSTLVTISSAVGLNGCFPDVVDEETRRVKEFEVFGLLNIPRA